MNMRIFYFCCISVLYSISAQNTEQIKVLAQQDFFWEQKDNHVFKKDYNNTPLDSFYFDTSNLKSANKIISINDAPSIVSISGGMVWEIINDTFVRTDHSYNHRLTYNSNVFVHKDTIFKFGGYGFWSTRNFFSYFSETTHEWEFYPIDPNSDLPPGLSRTDFSYYNNLFFISGGITVDPRDGISWRPNNNIWRFDFNTRKWSNLGTSNAFEYDVKSSLDIGQGRRLVSNLPTDEYPYSIYIIDYKSNQILPLEGYNDFPMVKSFYSNDSIYSLENKLIRKLSLSSFRPINDRVKSLYIDSASLFSGLYVISFVALVIMIGVLIILYTKNKNRPKLSPTGLRFKSTHYSLSVKEHKVLSLLIHNKTVDSKALLKAIYDADLSAPQNNRIKLEVINSLNEKLSKIFSIDEFVSFRKSRKDQRMVIYYTKYRNDFVL